MCGEGLYYLWILRRLFFGAGSAVRFKYLRGLKDDKRVSGGYRVVHAEGL